MTAVMIRKVRLMKAKNVIYCSGISLETKRWEFLRKKVKTKPRESILNYACETAIGEAKNEVFLT